jgi:hypothetical protein
MRKKYSGTLVTMTVPVPKKIHERLRAGAKKDGMRIGPYMVKCLKEYYEYTDFISATDNLLSQKLEQSKGGGR